jgi:cytochrome d ubiquinol oxidase subunit II
VRERSVRAASRLFFPLAGAWLAASLATAFVAPQVPRGLTERPLAWLATALFVGGLLTSFQARRKGAELAAFLGSCAFLLGLLAATAAAVYPVWLKSTLDPAWSLTALNSAASERALRYGLYWWPLGFALALAYFAVLLRIHRGRAQAAAEGEGY